MIRAKFCKNKVRSLCSNQLSANVIGESLYNGNSYLIPSQAAPFEELNFNFGRSSESINYINNYLVNYPDKNNFWEILNKNLVTSLLTDPIPTPYGIDYKLADVVDSLTVKIDVESTSSDFNIPRYSIKFLAMPKNLILRM